MAIDTKQRRMSAMDLGLPWRVWAVDPEEAGLTQDHRQAALFMYSGIEADEPPVILPPEPLPASARGAGRRYYYLLRR